MQLLRIFPLLFLFIPCLAQQQEKKAAIYEMNKLADNYKLFPYLSFRLNYYYSAQESPDMHVDSLEGRVKLHGNQYWYLLDSTEAVVAGNFIVTLFKEDKIMYITKPAAALQVANPVAILDSVLSKNDNILSTVTEKENTKIISIQFKDNPAFKKVEYYLDPITGLLSKVKMIVRFSLLQDPSLKGIVDTNDSYANIEVRYTDYKKEPFSDDIFNTTTYFKKEGEVFLPVAPYDSFKIFMGTLGNEGG
jgi:hypothetical protein